MSAAAGTALITGAAGHLGRSIARSLAQRSFTLAVHDIDPASLVQLVASIDGTFSFVADVRDPAAASELVSAVIDRLGPIDVLINAFGVEGPIAQIEDLRPADVQQVFDVNVSSLFWLCSAIVPSMKQRRKGRIVNIASGAGLTGGALASPYHASKHAVVGLTRSLARELAPHQIAVNAVCPGYIDSPMVHRIIDREVAETGRPAEIVEAIPMGRMGDADEVASVVSFLALDAPLYMSGSCLVVDGALRA